MKPILLIILIASSLNISAQNQRLNLVSDIWPPFTNTENNKSVALDIVKLALQRIDIETKYNIVDFEDVIVGVEKGTYDGSAALWESKEREKILIFSEPYLENQMVLVGLKGADVSVEKIAELEGKK